MSSDIVRNQTPEELELQRKQVELASLEADLIQRELDLATLRAELRNFERLRANSSSEITSPARISLRAVSIILRNSGLTLSESLPVSLSVCQLGVPGNQIKSRCGQLGLPDLAELWVAAGELLG
jgi:hypothetical protein